MNLRPYRSPSGPPINAPIAAPKALADSAAIRPTIQFENPKYSCHRVRLVARAMIEPASMYLDIATAMVAFHPLMRPGFGPAAVVSVLLTGRLLRRAGRVGCRKVRRRGQVAGCAC